MIVTVNNQVIVPSDVSLDDFGWDSAIVRGHLSLEIQLDRHELLAIGRIIWKYAQDAVAEESDYFEDEYLQDNPTPTSDHMFADEPELLAVYLNNNFWSSEVVGAIVTVVTNAVGYNPGRYLIQDFRRLEVNEDTVLVEFGAVPTHIHRT